MRTLVPGAIVIATAAVLLYAARDALTPAIAVHVVPVIPKPTVHSTQPADAGPQPHADGALDAEDRSGQVLVQAPGWVEPSPFAISVPALAEGVVREVLVLEGDRVRAGQVVARLIDEDATLRQRAAEAAFAQRQADLDQSIAALATADAQIRVAKADADELRDEVTRKRDLVDAGAISAGEFRRMQIRLDGLAGRADIAERLADEARALIAQSRSALAAADVVRDEARLALERMDIRSPVAGVVLARLVEPGSRIGMTSRAEPTGAGTTPGSVLRLYDPERLQVRVDVPLADAGKVSIGTLASITTEALPDITLTGVVTRAVHEANIQRNTVQFKVIIDRPSAILKPEMLTRVKLHGPGAARSSPGRRNPPTGNTQGEGADSLTLWVPAMLVMETSNGAGWTWVVDQSSGSALARKREVMTAPTGDEGFLAVTSGLHLSDRLILDPPAALRDGSRLDILGETSAQASTPSSR